MDNRDGRLDAMELDVIDLFDLTVTDVSEEAASFAVNQESGGSFCSMCLPADGC